MLKAGAQSLCLMNLIFWACISLQAQLPDSWQQAHALALIEKGNAFYGQKCR